MRLSPVDPLLHAMEATIAFAHFIAGRYGEAVTWADACLHTQDDYHTGLRILATSCALTGRSAKARAAVTRLRALNPTLRVRDLENIAPFRRSEDSKLYAEGLRLAGLPE
jgi:predicted Zn-dependent protease